jgi:hypothetical protein
VRPSRDDTILRDPFSAGAGTARRLGAIGIVALALSSCSGVEAGKICAAAGGTYRAGTCEAELGPAQREAKQWCETHGGVYLAGQGSCAFGEGGP